MGQCNEIICLPLYGSSLAEGKFVQSNAGVNLWKAGGRRRSENEIEIGIPEKFSFFNPFFFPGEGETFELRLPNYVTLTAKINKDGTAFNSTPSNELGRWLLRQVLKIPAGTIVSYEMLKERGVDAVYIEKWYDGSDAFYKIFPAPVGEFEAYAKNGIKERKEVKTAKELFIERMVAASNDNNDNEPGIQAGHVIIHKAFGRGIVNAINNDMVELDFNGTIKTFKYSWLLQNNMIKVEETA